MSEVLSFEEFNGLRPADKKPHLLDHYGELQSFIYTQQVDKTLLGSLVKMATTIKNGYNNGAFRTKLSQMLTGYSCVLYFTQPSTRTFASFSLAAKALGMHTEEIRDPNMSSLYKGESELDSLLTLAELTDVVIMRQASPSLIDEFAYELKRRKMFTRVINGGSGSDQHPTQALLDVYTIMSYLGIDKPSEDRYTVSMMGDLKHSRAVRSLSYLLSMYPKVWQWFVAPADYQIGPDIIRHLDESGCCHKRSFTRPDTLLSASDCIYLVRIQDEYHEIVPDSSEFSQYQLYVDDITDFKDGQIILHPLPRRNELPVEIDYTPQAKYWEAVRNGKFIRMALIMHMMDCVDEFWYKIGRGIFASL